MQREGCEALVPVVLKHVRAVAEFALLLGLLVVLDRRVNLVVGRRQNLREVRVVGILIALERPAVLPNREPFVLIDRVAVRTQSSVQLVQQMHLP